MKEKGIKAKDVKNLPPIEEIHALNIQLDEETARDLFACNDSSDLKKLLAKLKQKTLNARMKYDPALVES